jgi:hypothetical protein
MGWHSKHEQHPVSTNYSPSLYSVCGSVMEMLFAVTGAAAAATSPTVGFGESTVTFVLV